MPVPQVVVGIRNEGRDEVTEQPRKTAKGRRTRLTVCRVGESLLGQRGHMLQRGVAAEDLEQEPVEGAKGVRTPSRRTCPAARQIRSTTERSRYWQGSCRSCRSVVSIRRCIRGPPVPWVV